MDSHNAKADASFGAEVVRGAAAAIFGPKMKSMYHFECYDKNGNLKWEELVPNMVTDEGLNDLLDSYFKGSAYTAVFNVGLVDNTSWTAYAAGDTYAKINTTANPPTTNGWQECTAYTEGSRQTLTLGTVAAKSVDNTAAKAAFSINGTKTIRGAFVCRGTSKLYGEADFSGARSVQSGDTLNVSVTLTAS